MVRVAALKRRIARRRSDAGARRAHPRGDDWRPSRRASTSWWTRSTVAFSRTIQPLLAAEGIRPAPPQGDQRGAAALPRRVLPPHAAARADAAGRRPRPSLPVPRQPLAVPRGLHPAVDAVGAAGQLALRDPHPEPGPAALRRAARSRRQARLHAARGRDSPAPAEPLQRLRRPLEPRHPRHARRRSPARGAVPRICSPASRRGLRERRLGTAVRLQYDADLPPDILTTLLDELELSPEDLYEGEGFTAFSDLFQLYAAVDLPRLKDRPLPPQPVPAFERRAGHLERDPRAGRPRAPPVPHLRRRHALRARRRRRSQGARHQDDALPREPGLADRARAAHGRRERQGGRRPRGAAGALRRGGEHPLGARARGGGRPRRLRPRRLQDPLQGVPRRAPGGRRHPALLPPRHRQLQRAHGRRLRRPRALHEPRVVRRGPDRAVQPAHRLHAPARLPPPAARARATCATGSSSASAARPTTPGPGGRRGSSPR